MGYCVYDTCPAKLEITRLIEGHKRVTDKQHNIDIHHGELMNMNTKLSGKILEIGLAVEAHRKESDERHDRLIAAIEQLQITFIKLDESMSKIILANNMISWKVVAIFTAVSSALGVFGTWLYGLIK